MDNKDRDLLTYNFDEMSTSDLVMWLESHKDTDEICNKMYWSYDYVCKKWVKEMYQSEEFHSIGTDTHHMEDPFLTQMQEVLFGLYDVRQEIIFTVGDADKLHPKAKKFLDILKDTIAKIEALEKEI